MSLKFYRDINGQNEITAGNPDAIRKPVLAGGTATDITEIYLKNDDPNLTFSEIVLTSLGDEDGADASGEVDITYSLDGVSYVQSLSLPNGDYASAFKVFRKATAPNVARAFKRVDIEHELSFNEYVK